MSKVGEAKLARGIAFAEMRRKSKELEEVRRQALNKIYDVLEESQIPLAARQIARAIDNQMSIPEIAGNLQAIREGTSNDRGNALRDNRAKLYLDYEYHNKLFIEVDENGTPLTDIPIVMKKPSVLFYGLRK